MAQRDNGMTPADFHIGMEFTCGERLFRCTDVGTRIIAAIRVDQVQVGSSASDQITTLSREEAEVRGWFNGPPYAVAETVFDENDMEGCAPVESSP